MLPFFALIQSIIKSSCCSLLKPCSESNHISLLLSPLCWFRPPPLAYSTLTASWSVSCLLSLFSFPPNNPFPTHQPGWKVKHFMLSFPLNRPQLCIILDIQAHLLMVTYAVPLVSAASLLASTTFPWVTRMESAVLRVNIMFYTCCSTCPAHSSPKSSNSRFWLIFQASKQLSSLRWSYLKHTPRSQLLSILMPCFIFLTLWNYNAHCMYLSLGCKLPGVWNSIIGTQIFERITDWMKHLFITILKMLGKAMKKCGHYKIE